MSDPTPDLTVLVPSFNEADNVAEMVRRLDDALGDVGAVEVLYVDDSTDDTPQRVRAAAARTRGLDVRVLHRDVPTGGLAGAVSAGLAAARADLVVVMDGDLQHPPETVPALVAALGDEVDVVVASRYVPGGSAGGLAGGHRALVSRSSTSVAKLHFPHRLRGCSDPMTGFFALRRDRADLTLLRPRGFKILLELLASQPLRVAEVPLVFAERHAGASKASWRVGAQYLQQLMGLRLRCWTGNRLLRFAAVGALGAVLNLAIMAAAMSSGLHYVVASVVAAEVTIVGNFLAQEEWVFGDLTARSRASWWERLGSWLAFNNLDLLVRTPLLVVAVERLHVQELPAQAVLLALAFAARFVFSRQVVYRVRRTTIPAPRATRSKELAVHGCGTLPAPTGHRAQQLQEVLTSHRPWGHFEQLCLNTPATVKVITVRPGCRLSLQRHTSRSELWQVLDNPVLVTVGSLTWTAAEGERVVIPVGTDHRLANPGPATARVLEVATGHFDELDIERLHDDYARVAVPGSVVS